MHFQINSHCASNWVNMLTLIDVMCRVLISWNIKITYGEIIQISNWTFLKYMYDIDEKKKVHSIGVIHDIILFRKLYATCSMFEGISSIWEELRSKLPPFLFYSNCIILFDNWLSITVRHRKKQENLILGSSCKI